MAKAIMSLSDAAVGRINAILSKAAEAGNPVAGIRVGVKTKGCTGHSYEVEYANAPKPGDEVVEEKGVKVFVDAGAIMMLVGTEMDYETDKFKSGFVFKNPNEKGRCGCGESFHV